MLQAVRVAFVSHYSDLYGANLSLLGLIKGLSRLGVAPVVFCSKAGPFTEHVHRLGLAAHVVPYKLSVHWPPPREFSVPRRSVSMVMSRLRRWRRQVTNQRLLPRMAEQLRAERIEIVHTNDLSLSIGLKAARFIGKPHVWHIRSYGDLDYGCLPDGGQRQAKRLLAQSDALIFNSRSVMNHHLGGTPHPCCEVIYNGIYTEEDFAALSRRAEEARCTTRELTFAMVGYIQKAKGQFAAVEALAHLSRRGVAARLVVAGEGAIAGLLAHARSLGVEERVRCLGYVPDPTKVYLDTDVVLMCSRMEAFGRVTVEAMACGCAVLANASGGSVEILKNEETGLLYDGTVEGLAAGMERLATEPDYRRRLAIAGQADAARRFTIEEYCRRVLAVYKRLGARQGST
jgi:glycosyltransferase involved in cell wall biosynthesis